MKVDEDWYEILFGNFVGPIPRGGIKRTAYVPEVVYQSLLEYAAGRSRYIEFLKGECYDYDTLLQAYAGALQYGDMQERRLERQVQALKEWQTTTEVSTELSERSLELVKEAQASMINQYALGIKHGKSEISKKGAEKRHKEHRSMKSEVFKWLDNNMDDFKSMDKAAEHIAKNRVPVAFRTARAWVGEWKKLRSASKA